jgi:hypothetical protein
MAIELITKYATAVDELFKAESKRQLVTNTDYDFINAHTVKIYKVTTAKMNDYNRAGTSNNYGEPETLEATTEQFTLSRDRSFTYVLDRLDADETGNALNATTSLARQLREVVIPEIDTWIYKTMSEQAGTTATATLTSDNIYNEILTASEVLDNAEVPEQERCIIVTPSIYTMMKQNSSIVMQTEAGAETRNNGVVAMLDGISVIKVPSNRLPEKCGFIVCHKSATVAPYKLEDYKAHDNPPGINGYLCEGRFVYDAKVLDNKAMGVYYHTV